MYTIKKLRIVKASFYKRKGGDIMAIALPKNTPAIIISKNQTSSFFKTLNQNMPTKEFWNDCKILRESISSSDLDAMDNLIAKRINKNE